MALSFRPATRAQRQLGLLWFAAAASAAVLRPVWLAVAPQLKPCAFRGLTGIPCPTCGTTRTAVALLDLDLAAAFAVNPLAAWAGLAFFIGGPLALIWALAGSRIPALDRVRSRWWPFGLVALVLINWVYLIVRR